MADHIDDSIDPARWAWTGKDDDRLYVFEQENSAQHTAWAHFRIDDELQVDCSCGAQWVHRKDITREQMRSIYESHLKYFNRKPMETL